MNLICDNMLVMIATVLVSSCQLKSKDNLVMIESENSKMNNFILLNDSVSEKNNKLINNLEVAFEKDYPTYYGGYNIVNDELVIIVVGEDTSAMRADLVKKIGYDYFAIDIGKYSYKSLMEIMECITDYIEMNKDGYITENIESYEIKGNRVLVCLKDNSYNNCQEFRQYVTDSPAVGLTKKKEYFNSAD